MTTNHPPMDIELQRSEGDSNNSPLRQRWRTEHLSPSTLDILGRDEAVFMHQSLSTPCLNAIAQASGARLTDLEGRTILDFHGNSVHQVGFAHPEVIAAIIRQLQTLPFCTRRYTNEVAVEFAERLASTAPPALTKVLLCPSGAGAIGMALKLVRLVTGRYRTLSFWGSFHGASLDAISVGGEALFRKGMGPLLRGSVHAAPVDADGQCERSLRQIRKAFARYGDIGAVVAEPVRWSTVSVPPMEYWKEVRELCTRHGALLVFDEIGTGLGRTGRMYAFEHFDVEPDILVLGKGLGGGVLPLAAILARGEYDIAGDRALGHYTHEKNPACCAAGLATLNVIAREQLTQAAARKGALMLERLQALRERYPVIRAVRGLGLLLGVEMQDSTIAERIMYECVTRGLSFKVSNGAVLTLVPPLTIELDEIERALDILEQALCACAAD